MITNKGVRSMSTYGPHNFDVNESTQAFAGHKCLSERMYERPQHYAGETYYGCVALMGHHRDSDMLTESNWDVMCAAFEGSENVIRASASHWAVGWVEVLYMLPTATESEMDEAESMLAALADYPILDEDDLSRREMDAAYEYWNGWTGSADIQHRIREIQYWNKNRRGHWEKPIPIFAARHELDKLSELYPDFEQYICEMARES